MWAIKKVGAKRENDICRFIPMTSGGYMHHFTLKKMKTKQHDFKQSGGTHAAAAFSMEGELLCTMEDIGRHNAVDKIVGYLLKNQIKRDDVYIITSGRISSDILLKSALINIGLVVSRSAPTSLAVKLAEKLNITIVGFARGKKLNIYTHSDRLV